jgi:hypothetical protein
LVIRGATAFFDYPLFFLSKKYYNSIKKKKEKGIMAKVNKYWGLVAIGALTAAAAGAAAAYFMKRPCRCPEKDEDIDSSESGSTCQDTSEEEKEPQETFATWDTTAQDDEADTKEENTEEAAENTEAAPDEASEENTSEEEHTEEEPADASPSTEDSDEVSDEMEEAIEEAEELEDEFEQKIKEANDSLDEEHTEE